MTRQVGVGVGEGINLFLEMLVIQAFFPLEYLSYMFFFSFASGVNLFSGCQIFWKGIPFSLIITKEISG